MIATLINSIDTTVQDRKLAMSEGWFFWSPGHVPGWCLCARYFPSVEPSEMLCVKSFLGFVYMGLLDMPERYEMLDWHAVFERYEVLARHETSRTILNRY